MSERRELLYVADPMCSWCWGFAPTIEAIGKQLAPDVTLRYVMGGLAPDSDEPMPDDVRGYVRSAWDAVERATGARFNRDFWDECAPRRSTWPACRAVVAATAQVPAAGPALFKRIQRAYYREARNPSERETLIALAGELDAIDAARFEADLDAPSTKARLQADFHTRDRLGVSGFPSLAASSDEGDEVLVNGWAPLEQVHEKLVRIRLLRP